MHEFLTAFFWGIAILISLLGWGFLAMRAIGLPEKLDFGWQGPLGLCVSVAVGGFLNLTHSISKNSVLFFLSAGWLLFLIFLILENGRLFNSIKNFWQQVKTRKILAILTMLLLSIVLIRYASSVAFFGFHGTDDQHAYMAFPAKMLQTGALGNDPFSERRVVSSLGGKYFLDTFVLTGADFKNLHLMENGIGFIIFLMVLIGFLKDRKVPLNFSLAILLLASIIPSPSGNITGFFTVAVLFIAIIRLILLKDEEKQKKAVLLALSFFVATLYVLKSNVIFTAAILFLSYFILRFKSGVKRAIVAKEFTLAIIVILVIMLPWMISMKNSSNTWLYPFLGKGFEGSAYGTFLSHYFEFNKYGFLRLASEIIFGLCLFVPFAGLGVIWLKVKNSEIKKTVLFFLFASLIGVLAMIYGIGGYGLYYYSFAFLLPTILVAVILLFQEEIIFFGKQEKTSGVFLASLFLVFMFGAYIQKNTEEFQGIKTFISSDARYGSILSGTNLASQADIEQYKALQASVPAGEPILARLDRNFLFNFSRNQIYIIDLPGGASLPPGMPSFKGSEKVADYFVSKGVKYVAYSYGNEANYSRRIDGSMLRPHVNPLLRTEALHSFDFQDNLMELAKSRKKVYDDGKNFVLDLSLKP